MTSEEKAREKLRELLNLSIKLEIIMYGIMRRYEAKINDDYNGF